MGLTPHARQRIRYQGYARRAEFCLEKMLKGTASRGAVEDCEIGGRDGPLGNGNQVGWKCPPQSQKARARKLVDVLWRPRMSALEAGQGRCPPSGERKIPT